MGGRLLNSVNAVTGSRDALAATARTTAWFSEPSAIPEHKAAVLTGGWFENESLLTITGDGFYDMGEVIFHLPFRNAEKLRKLIGGEAGACQELDNPLTGRL
jgi:hypothetical protein